MVDDAALPLLPESRTAVKKKSRLSLVWILPIAAAVVGAWVAVTSILSTGPKISVVFKSAEGLEPGKTKVHYNGVDVGTIMKVRLADDARSAIATLQMDPETESFLVEGTHFWVVRPRISGANVTGLGTLISGAYIGMEIGASRQTKRSFVALETPPLVTGDAPGRFFVMKTEDLGSLDSGTPIYFRRLQVGQVTSYELDKEGRSLTVKTFVNAPYDRYVTANTRFWQASGIDLSLSAAGLSVQTQSVLSLLIGGVAFETPATGPVLPEAEPNHVFTLFDDRAAAFALPPQDPQTFVLLFKQSVRGLAPGAPVEFQGIPIGEVAEIKAQIDMGTAEFSVPVTIHLDASKLGVKVLNVQPGEDLAAAHRRVMDLLVSRGLRAQLKPANLLTGTLMVTADFIPDAPPVTIDWTQDPVQLPTVSGGFDAIQANLASVLAKLDALPYQALVDDLRNAITGLDQTLLNMRNTIAAVDELVVKKLGNVPFESIGEDLRKVIVSMDQTLGSTRRAIDNADALLRPDSAIGGELSGTLQDVARAARALAVLADYLERHPEALLRGKTGEGN